MSMAQYVEDANRETLVCVMIEDTEGMDHLDEMLKVEGVEVYFVDSGDLSQSLGLPGRRKHPTVLDAVDRYLTRIMAAGEIAGVSCPTDLIPEYIDRGVLYFHSSTQVLMRHAAEVFFNTVRPAADKRRRSNGAR